MKYSDSEVSILNEEDFTIPFVGNFGSVGNDIDVLTVVHHKLNFDEVYKSKEIFSLIENINIYFVCYDFLKEMKLYARRPKDVLDITERGKLKNCID